MSTLAACSSAETATDPSVETSARAPVTVEERTLDTGGGRERLRATIGDAADAFCDAEMVDSFYYTVFPNFHPWGSFNGLVYRFRPNAMDPETSWMDVWLLRPFSGERPAPAPRRVLDLDAEFTEAPELGQYARVFHQDTFNLADVQRGLHTLRLSTDTILLSRYQEAKIRHFHELYDECLGL